MQGEREKGKYREGERERKVQREREGEREGRRDGKLSGKLGSRTKGRVEKHTVPTFEECFGAVLFWGDNVRPRSCQALYAQRPVVQNTSGPELVLVIRLPFPSKACREVKKM